MLFSANELASFCGQGFLLKEGIINPDRIASLSSEANILKGIDSESRVMERDGKTVRALHGCHSDNSLFDDLIRSPTLLNPVRQILESEVYLYQFKINIKAAIHGDVWPWHQDYIFWRNEDGMPAPRAISVLIFLDEVTEFNGPVYFMPGSHREGTIESFVSEAKLKTGWQENVSADLKYGIDDKRVEKLVTVYGLAAPKGPAGSALFFDCNIVHGSPSNISPFARRTIIITYNAIDNIQRPGASARPEFLVGRDYRPLTPVL